MIEFCVTLYGSTEANPTEETPVKEVFHHHVKAEDEMAANPGAVMAEVFAAALARKAPLQNVVGAVVEYRMVIRPVDLAAYSLAQAIRQAIEEAPPPPGTPVH